MKTTDEDFKYMPSPEVIEDLKFKMRLSSSAGSRDISVYIRRLETLVQEACDEDFWGTEGFNKAVFG